MSDDIGSDQPWQEDIIEIFRAVRRDSSPIPLSDSTKNLARATLPATEGFGFTPEPIEAVAFDIYGTLVISASGDIGQAGGNQPVPRRELRRLLDEYEIDASPEELADALEAAISTSHSHSRAEGISFPEVDIREMWRCVGELDHLSREDILLFSAQYEALVNPVAPMPGLREVLRHLKDAKYRHGHCL